MPVALESPEDLSIKSQAFPKEPQFACLQQREMTNGGIKQVVSSHLKAAKYPIAHNL
jgi:hypothetical protein